MKTTLVICPKCNLHANFEPSVDSDMINFAAVKAADMLITLTRERRISYADAGRLMVEVDDWIQSLPKHVLETLRFADQQHALYDLFRHSAG